MTSTYRTKIEAAAQDLFANGRLDAIPRVFSPNYTVHLTTGDVHGYAPILGFFETIHGAFPALGVQTEILMERGEQVCWQRTLRGVQRKALHGFPALNREVVWRDMVVSRFENELIVEEWVVSDLVERVLLARKKA
jgi:predicted ester cyclase